jgi:nanoRNase/pAp phosphatase (c-di-AMP/oligoRNAs hydrolase)
MNKVDGAFRGRVKREIATLPEKNRIVGNILRALVELDGFLIVGHKNPDEDCIASMVAFGLLASKFNRAVYIHIHGEVHEQFRYLLNICTYNSIKIVGDSGDLPGPLGALVILDTPKPELLEYDETMRPFIEDPSIRSIEIDHHIGSDSTYMGDTGYCLVTTASSASELVGLLAMKVDLDEALKARHQVGEVLSRNLVLAVLTGIIGDSRMGKFLKTRRERWFYERFSAIFDRLLAQKTRKGTGNFTSKEEVFNAIAHLSTEEQECFARMMERRRSKGALEYIVLPADEAAAIYATYGNDTMTQVAKSVADVLAEEGGKLSLIAFPDASEVSDFIQFRVRRCQSFTALDLRSVLERLQIANGGGHPGAVGFRFPKTEIANFAAFAESIVAKIDGLVLETSR